MVNNNLKPEKTSSGFGFKYDLNKAGSLYQGASSTNGQVNGINMSIHATETPTVSDLSIPQSLQQSSNSFTGNSQSNMASPQLWPSTSSQSFFDHEKTKRMMEDYVQKNIFPCLKFISSPEMIAFSWDKMSLCQVVCSHFQVNTLDQTRFWAVYSKYISQKLNKKQAEISNIMKQAFKGKKSTVFLFL